MGVGYGGSGGQGGVGDRFSAGADTWGFGGTAITLYQGTGFAEGNVTSMDIDGFTINWTKSVTPTGTATIMFIAFK